MAPQCPFGITISSNQAAFPLAETILDLTNLPRPTGPISIPSVTVIEDKKKRKKSSQKASSRRKAY